MSLKSCLFTKMLCIFNVLFWISLLCVFRYMDINMILYSAFIQNFVNVSKHFCGDLISQ